MEIWLGIIGVSVAGCLIGYSIANHDILEECRKQHNVYECVVVAIPKDKEGVYK